MSPAIAGSVAANHSAAARPSGGERVHVRKAPRMPHRTPCRVRWFDAATAHAGTCVGQTCNLSADGMAVRVGHAVAPGTRIEALVPLRDGEPTFVYGVVAHCRKVLTGTFELGILFGGEFTTGAC